MLWTAQSRRTAYAGVAALVLCLTIFPFGSMETHLVPAAVARWFPGDGSARTVAVREGLTETVVYVERQMLGRPQSYAMLTNAFSMSATSYGARRYMKLYVLLADGRASEPETCAADWLRSGQHGEGNGRFEQSRDDRRRRSLARHPRAEHRRLSGRRQSILSAIPGCACTSRTAGIFCRRPSNDSI